MKIISLARFFARIDDPADPNSYLIYQTGKFFPLYRVDQANKSYTRLTPGGKSQLESGPCRQSRDNPGTTCNGNHGERNP